MMWLKHDRPLLAQMKSTTQMNYGGERFIRKKLDPAFTMFLLLCSMLAGGNYFLMKRKEKLKSHDVSSFQI